MYFTCEMDMDHRGQSEDYGRQDFGPHPLYSLQLLLYTSHYMGNELGTLKQGDYHRLYG